MRSEPLTSSTNPLVEVSSVVVVAIFAAAAITDMIGGSTLGNRRVGKFKRSESADRAVRDQVVIGHP